MRHSWVLPALLLFGSTAAGAENRSVQLRVDHSWTGTVRRPRFADSPLEMQFFSCSRYPLASDAPASVYIPEVSPGFAGSDATLLEFCGWKYSTRTNLVRYNYTWLRGRVTSKDGITYEVLMYCYSEFGQCAMPSKETAYAAKLTEKVSTLDSYLLASHKTVNLKVKADGKHDVTWTIWQARRMPPAN